MITASPLRRAPTVLPGSAMNFAGKLLLAASAIGASPQSDQLQRQLHDVAFDFALPASGKRTNRRERFSQLSKQWRKDTQWLSSTTEIATHPAYQAIIGMGPDALPLILEDLQVNSGHWYWALKSISNEDPVPPRDRGAIKKMKEAWLRWGRNKGVISA